MAQFILRSIRNAGISLTLNLSRILDPSSLLMTNLSFELLSYEFPFLAGTDISPLVPVKTVVGGKGTFSGLATEDT